MRVAIVAVFWGCLLNSINSTSKQLQCVEIVITIVIDLYEVSIDFVGETGVNIHCFKKKVKMLRCDRKRKLVPGETYGRVSFRINTFLVIIDTLSEELTRRGILINYSSMNFSLLLN